MVVEGGDMSVVGVRVVDDMRYTTPCCRDGEESGTVAVVILKNEILLVRWTRCSRRQTSNAESHVR